MLPAGGMRGSSVSIEVAGQRLKGVSAVVSGRGVSVESVEPSPSGDSAAVRLKIAPDAPLGPRELRLTSNHGASNAAKLWIDAFPDRVEKEPNEDSSSAQTIDQFPIVVNGRSQSATDRDTYVIPAKAGETWVFDCNAARIRSRMDPVLELRDKPGKVLKMAQSTWESDPRLIYQFTDEGPYYLTVRDTQFYGGPDYGYRLTVGQIPAVDGHVPRGERPGRPLGLEVTGVGLPRPRAIVNIPPDTPEGPFWTTLDTPLGPSLPICLLVGSYPVTGITETDATMPMPLLPAYIDGIFNRFPRYRFIFRGTTKDHFHFEAWARRIGSRVDPALRIRDMAGKELASNDDITPAGQLLEANGKDSRLVFKPPIDGLYTLEVRNVDDRVGPDCFYRIEARKQAPDFTVNLNLDRINVGEGGTVVWTVNVQRLGGFEGPVKVTARDLPAGVTFRGGVIAPGRATLEVTASARAGQSLGVKEVRIVGEALLAGKPAYRIAVPRDDYMHRHANPALFGDEPYVKPYRPSELLLLGVTSRAEPFSIAVESPGLTMAPGQKAEVTVRAARNPGADGEIKLEYRGLPAKVTAAPASLPAGKSEVRVTLTAAADAPLSSSNLVVVGKIGAAAQPAPAIEVIVKK